MACHCYSHQCRVSGHVGLMEITTTFEPLLGRFQIGSFLPAGGTASTMGCGGKSRTPRNILNHDFVIERLLMFIWKKHPAEPVTGRNVGPLSWHSSSTSFFTRGCASCGRRPWCLIYIQLTSLTDGLGGCNLGSNALQRYIEFTYLFMVPGSMP
ncbi:hypothetical protein PAXRUDRAFT_324759 [Paxillus rubicundulus Ve08.2h10]|uniref:Uncharacterized protein n=1 Tax=Paxillus rubicundulus Ve08.2h10 TaxID=930991 RepID=A0A0D0E4P0_9AGAM|nr:hypothetical protein PAXRUDRAFT_324759 [Paxillus rubicundulus Ve08.2h10]